MEDHQIFTAVQVAQLTLFWSFNPYAYPIVWEPFQTIA